MQHPTPKQIKKTLSDLKGEVGVNAVTAGDFNT
jgi:hypothetical protein